MDSAALDRLARLLAGTPTRRTALAGLAAAVGRLVAAPIAVVAQPGALCRPPGHRCFPDHGITCCGGARCQHGRCRCPGRQKARAGSCRPHRPKPKRCRDRDCKPGEVGRQGRCRCPGGTRRCQTRCLARDRCCTDAECGVCNRCQQERCVSACAADQVCLSNGSCALDCGGGGSCPADCGCSFINTEGASYCVDIPDCADIPQVCTSTGDCPRGQHCQSTLCAGGARCVPLCTS